MFTLKTDRTYRDCEGATRREFLRVGTLGAGALTLGGLLAARAAAAKAGKPLKNRSVIWLWLAGGPTHIETFDPKLDAPSEYRSVTGESATKMAGVTIGGTLPQIASVAHKMAIVRSFAHTNSGHAGGTHYVTTGYDNRSIDNGGVPTRPSVGSIVARVRGANDAHTGMPTYVRLTAPTRLGIDGPAFLGASCAPFDPAGQALKNMTLAVSEKRLDDRRTLLAGLDRMNSIVDRSGMMDGIDRFEEQAFNLVLGGAPAAFDLSKEKPKTVARYGKGLGEQLLRARRLCEAGCGFVTLSYGGWDMHQQIETNMKRRSPEFDQAVSAFVSDVAQRGLSDDILLVITGEFGRTPKVNKNAGREHWAPLSSLVLSGGGLRMGQVVGESAPKADMPKSKPIRPQDLMATMFHVLGIDPQVQFVNPAGRPVSMIEEGRPIEELV
jgi:uncharacterized protein (DUF1501 family)